MNWWSGEYTSSSINDVRCDLADLVPEENNKTPSPPRKSACFQVTFQENGWECNLSPGYDGAGTSNITTAAPSYALLSSQVPNFVARMQPRVWHAVVALWVRTKLVPSFSGHRDVPEILVRQLHVLTSLHNLG